MGTVEELVEGIDEPTLFCGEAVANWGGTIRDILGSLAVVADAAPAQRAWALGQVGWERLAEGKTEDLASLQPNYLRMPSIGRPKQRDRMPQRS